MAAGDNAFWSDLAARAGQYYLKASTTNRVSTTVLADDPDLSGIPLVQGQYEIELNLMWTQSVLTPKLKTRWIYSASWNTATRMLIGAAPTNTADPAAATPITLRSANTDTQDATYGTYTGGGFGNLREICIVTTNAAGNFSLQWAQSVSDPGQVSVKAGSYFRIVRIA